MEGIDRVGDTQMLKWSGPDGPSMGVFSVSGALWCLT